MTVKRWSSIFDLASSSPKFPLNCGLSVVKQFTKRRHHIKHSGDYIAYRLVCMCVQGSRVRAKYVIACSGLYSDRVAIMSGCAKLPKIVPFRGEYLLLKPERSNLVRGNIYPVCLLLLCYHVA